MSRIQFLAIIVVLTCISCSTSQVRQSLDSSLEQYNEQVRWLNFDQAALFSPAATADKFRARAEAAKNVRIIEYQIIGVKYDEKAQEALAVIGFKYYLLTSGTVKNLTDSQQWVYSDTGSEKGWKLKSLLPEFR